MPHLQQQTSAPDVNVNANDLAAQIRAQVNAQLKQAGVDRAKSQGGNTDVSVKRGANGEQVTVITKNGKVTTIHSSPGVAGIAPLAPLAPVAPLDEQDAPVVGSSTTVPQDQPLDVPPRVENLGYALFLMIAVIAIGKPVIRAIGNVFERRATRQALPADFGGRLERIEQGIEAVSIEVERISESQRYLLKVQSPTPERVEIPRSAG